MSKPALSVIIPVKNGAQTLEKCLSSIRSQTIRNIEIIILDSTSIDNSKVIAFRYNAKVIDIPEGTFNHGLTRNAGVQHATANFLFYTVQDAWLSENDLLEKMVKHFENDKIMGVVGHQAVPHEKDKNPLVWFKRFSEPVAVTREVKDVTQFEQSSQAKQEELIAWDDVVAMYRKSALSQQPFVETQFAEDWIWSRDALLRGWTLIYDPSIVVYHYHHSDYLYAYKVAFAVNYHFYKYFNFKPKVPDLFMPMVKAVYHVGKNRELQINEKIYWVYHNVASKVGTFSSHINFLIQNYIGGIKSVEKRYNKVCGEIPQGRQRH